MIDTDILIDAGRGVKEAVACLKNHYRLSHGLLIADSLIAASALTLNAQFISRNQRDYQFIAGLNLLPYP